MARPSFRTQVIVCLGFAALGTALWRPWTLLAQGLAPANVKLAAISQNDMKEWLTYLASDALQLPRTASP